MNILITSVGRRVSLVEYFVNEIVKFNNKSKVFCADLNPELSSACKFSHKAFKTPSINSENYIERLLELCIDNQIKLLIPTIDTELIKLSENIDQFKENDIQVVISDLNFVKICRNKFLTNIFFETNGINIPEQFNKSNLKFPLFIKPFDGSLSNDLLIVPDVNYPIPKKYLNDRFMYMKYLDPLNYEEFTVDMYFNKHGVLKCLIPRLRIQVRGGETSKGITLNNSIVPFLIERLSVIEGARGCITMQLFKNKKSDEFFGIEINPRFGGGYPLSYAAGGNYPKMIIEEYLQNKEIEFENNWKTDLLMLRYDQHVLVENYNI